MASRRTSFGGGPGRHREKGLCAPPLADATLPEMNEINETIRGSGHGSGWRVGTLEIDQGSVSDPCFGLVGKDSWRQESFPTRDGLGHQEFPTLGSADGPGHQEFPTLGSADGPGHQEFPTLGSADGPGHQEFPTLASADGPGHQEFPTLASADGPGHQEFPTLASADGPGHQEFPTLASADGPGH